MAKAPCTQHIDTAIIICFSLLLCILTQIRGALVPTERDPLTTGPSITSVKVLEVNAAADDQAKFKNVVFEISGRDLKIQGGFDLRTTGRSAPPGGPCDFGENDSDVNSKLISSFNVSEVLTGSQRYQLRVPSNFKGDVFLCLVPRSQEAGVLAPKWVHQGPDAVVRVRLEEEVRTTTPFRRKRVDDGQIVVHGLRMETSEPEVSLDENGVPSVLAEAEYVIRLFGANFLEDMYVTFTDEPGKWNDNCQFPVMKAQPVIKESFTKDTVRVKVVLPARKQSNDTYYVCTKENNSTLTRIVHQGSEYYLQMTTYTTPLPTWLTIVIVIVCLCFSALFSGLNLGLMSLNRTELKILCNTGTETERKYARTIQPVRDHGNYLLCSILLGNVFVNSIFTILLDSLTSGLVAVIFSTIAIVLFGEIAPQAACSRHGLAVGAKTIWITKVVMVLTFPLSYPVSKMLDFVLGEEIGSVYNRERLKELVKVTTGENDLDKDEVNIISGALELRKKTVADVMTKIEDVFMLDYEAVLDFETVSEIMKSGYSRVPVYEGNRQNIVTMLYIKDLAFVDPDDNTPLKTLCQFYQNPINFVFEDVTLDVMFKIFKEGNKGHMAFVHRVNNEGEGDPFYETIGLITLEDVIEELIQAEIMDETDVFTDNRTKRRRNAERRQDFSVFAQTRGEAPKIRISPQMTLAAFQFLSTAVEQFVPSVISETILKRLLKQDIVYVIKKNKEWRTDPANVIYQQGKAVDYFVLILEGRVEVTVGKENLTFEGGPFTYFGTQALIQNIGVAESPSMPTSTMGSLESLNLDAMLRHTFHPDYTVRAISEVVYLKIRRSLYLAAKRATLMERSQKYGGGAGGGGGSAAATQNNADNFDLEVDKLLHSLEDEDADPIIHKKPSSLKHRKDSRSGAGGGNNPPTDQGWALGNQTSPNKNTSSGPPPVYSSMSPPHRLSGQQQQKDINGSIRASPVDDIQVVTGKDEESATLLPKGGAAAAAVTGSNTKPVS